MKKIIMIIFAMTMALTASAQYSDSYLIVKNGHIYAGGVKLSDEQAAECFRDIYGTDRSGDYLKYARGYRRGLGMTIGGGTAFLAGAGVSAAGFAKILMKGIGKEDFKRAQTMTMASSFVTIGGAVVMLVGIPTLTKNSARLNNLASYYNAGHSHPAEVTLGPTPNGIGFALNF